MKKNLLACLLLCNLNIVHAECNIAVVDLQQIVSSSPEVKQLKLDYQHKLKDLEKIIVNARGEISQEKDSIKILKIEDKYTKEFNSKKEIIDREYNSKLSKIENDIKSKIKDKAKKDNYDYIFAKSVVLFGGKDITNEICH